jgi:hypothetical protein
MFRVLPRRRPAPKPPLSCKRCEADALCPIAWETFGDDHWLMWMRCGECGGWVDTIVDNRTAAAIDAEMDRQQSRIAAQADALAGEQMAAEVEAFVSALERDLFDASDFAR